MRYYESIGGIPPKQALGATWVVNIRVRSLRRYEFIRKSDEKRLVKGETDWVFVNAQNSRPLCIPEQIVFVGGKICTRNC